MSNKHIVLIDDDKEDHEIFFSALKKLSRDLSYLAYTDGRLALSNMMDKKITPDIIFLDWNMPLMTGHEFLQEIKQQPGLDHIPVIIYSTTSDLATIKLTKTLGAADFITKPDTIRSLVELLQPIIN